MAAAATARTPRLRPGRRSRKAPARRKPPAPKAAAVRPAPASKAASPARKTAPARRGAPARRPGGQLIPLAVGTATAVRHLPDSSLMVRMTRGRAWIGVLGVLLAGIVALNVVTLSFAASAGQIDQNIEALEQENSILSSRDAQRSGVGAGPPRSGRARAGDARGHRPDPATCRRARATSPIAAQRLAAAGTGY